MTHYFSQDDNYSEKQIDVPPRSIIIDDDTLRYIEALRNQGHEGLSSILLLATLLISIISKISVEHKFKRKPVTSLRDSEFDDINEIQSILGQLVGVFEADRGVIALFHPSSSGGLETEMSVFKEFLVPGANSVAHLKNISLSRIRFEISNSTHKEYSFLPREIIQDEGCLTYLNSVGIHGSIYRRLLSCGGEKIGIIEFHNLRPRKNTLEGTEKNILEDPDRKARIEIIHSNLLNKMNRLILANEGVIGAVKSIFTF